MENYTIDELLHNANEEDEDKELCNILKVWIPKNKKIVVTYEDKSKIDDRRFVIKILDKGISERTEHFKNITNLGKRLMEIITDYYGSNIIYDNKKRESKELKEVICLYKNKKTFFQGVILRDYKEQANE